MSIQQSIKIAVLGASLVGKSCIALRFSANTFTEEQVVTIGAAFVTQTLQINNQPLKYEIWDTVGQERFSAITPMYFRDAECVIIVYDITDMETFGRALKYVIEVRQKSPLSQVLALCGNKCDLEKEREVPTEKGMVYAKQNGLLFFETSAKTNVNILELFIALGEKYVKKVAEENAAEAEKAKIIDKEQKSQRSGCC